MTISGIDVLLVGPGFRHSQALTNRMRRWGFRCHFAGSVRRANELVNSVRVDLVLSNVRLPDGTGFGLVAGLSGLPVTAFLCLPVEDSCFWLPAIDGGRDCLGSPALWPSEFANALEEMARCLRPAPRVN
jgi:response regulator RpfG family c-di-GMP phosphodiesterase